MTTLLVRDAERIETFDDADRAYDGASIFVRGGVIEAIGPAAELPQAADRIVDARRCIVLPGGARLDVDRALARRPPAGRGSSMLEEARQALLLQRVGSGAKAISARDVVGFRLDTLALAGAAVHDPFGALVFARSPGVDFAVVAGTPLIEHGAFTRLDVERLVAEHNRLAREMAAAA